MHALGFPKWCKILNTRINFSSTLKSYSNKILLAMRLEACCKYPQNDAMDNQNICQQYFPALVIRPIASAVLSAVIAMKKMSGVNAIMLYKEKYVIQGGPGNQAELV